MELEELFVNGRGDEYFDRAPALEAVGLRE
jgi:hypothetical protein